MMLAAYFDRIGTAGGVRADIEGLRALTRLHPQAIAFENLNTLMRLPVPLDLESLEAKLVRSPRGGYCFEQNALLAAVLEQLGFTVQRLAARVVWGAGDAPAPRNPRTHMVLLVALAGENHLCDVGFGGITPTAPLELLPDAEQSTPHETFRLLRGGHGRADGRGGSWLLQARVGGQWRDVYLFDLQPQEAVDYEMANHYVCSHPTSHFRSTLIAARAFEGGRYALRNRTLTTYLAGDRRDERVLANTAEIIDVLYETFGIVVPDPQRLHAAIAGQRILERPAG